MCLKRQKRRIWLNVNVSSTSPSPNNLKEVILNALFGIGDNKENSSGKGEKGMLFVV